MTEFVAPLNDIRFALSHIAGLENVTALPGLESASPDLVDAVLEEAGRLASAVLAPLNAVGDRHGAVLENGVVRTAPGFRQAFEQFRDAGWMGVVFPEEHGGQNLPWTLGTALADIWNAANMTLQLCPLLTQGAIEAILHHGTDAQKATYARKLISGIWTGAMCLTEPQAGSDVGALRTRAERDGDVYRIRGQKIFITFGEHDMAENIVHLVLARLPDAPAGTRGISLFIVPKFLPDADGNPGERNDMRCIKLEHKLGINGSPTCIMAYGEDEGAVGWLLGSENQGMRCMFTMMNNARLSVGHEGLGIAERAYQDALSYASERSQGQVAGKPMAIIGYPDVRRMLVGMRAKIAAMRALCYWTAGFVDEAARHGDPARRGVAADRVALLTPVVKAWCTDLAQEVASTGVQVHGGMGFIEETGVAQHYRDAKILAIYEGTNGIQAMDLVGRKLSIGEGRLPWLLISELDADIDRVPGELRLELRLALERMSAATSYVQAADETIRAAAASPYLRMVGHTVAGFLLARGAAAAAADSRGASWPGLARFWARHVLPETHGHLAAITAGAQDLDVAVLAA